MVRKLKQDEIDKAYRLFYGDGQTLGEVAKQLVCGIYDLSPWLTVPATRIASAAIAEERARAAQRAAATVNLETLAGKC